MSEDERKGLVDADGSGDETEYRRGGLAALVRKQATEAVVSAFERRGIYDDSRKRGERGECVAVPVTDDPRAVFGPDLGDIDPTDLRGVVETTLPARIRGLEDILAARGFSEAERERAPSSWAVVGSVILVDFGDCRRREAVGNALLSLHREAETIVARGGIEGVSREPTGEVVAGTGETDTVHTEHGIDYALDLDRVMFSPGNKRERERMGEVVASGESVLDCFAGIGYFTLPMATAGAEVVAVEQNPEACSFLRENVERNGLEGQVRVVEGDCRAVTPGVVGDEAVDRVVMGYYDAAAYVDVALDALSEGTIHLHAATPEPVFPRRPRQQVLSAVAERGLSATVEDRVVKTHSEGVVHGVLDVRVG
ncbi:MAG: class I SAM-dependent methyltransferase family protein [Natronomonas sp.]